MIWIDSHSRVDEGVIVGNSRTCPLLFANDSVLLQTSKQGLKNAFDRFSAACIQAGTNASQDAQKQCILQVSGNTLQQVRFKHPSAVWCHSRVREFGTKIDTRIPRANAFLRELCCSVMKMGSFKDRKAFSF